MTRHLSPRRLSRPVAKAKAVTKFTESTRRNDLRQSGMQADRRRGWHRGARR
jgi:hypothetical protein